MKVKVGLILAIWCSILASTPSFAKQDADLARVKANISHVLGNKLEIQQIEKTPIDGLYEVFANNNIFYFDRSGRYVISGMLADAKSGVNLTEQRLAVLSKATVAQFPLKNAIRHVKGKGKRILYVFEDPNCPYCQRLDKELEKVDNLTVYTFVIPILGADSKVKSEAILCSKNPSKVWQDWMLEHKVPKTSSSCNIANVNQKLTANLKLASQLGIRGIPAIYLQNGMVYQGERTATALDTAAK